MVLDTQGNLHDRWAQFGRLPIRHVQPDTEMPDVSADYALTDSAGGRIALAGYNLDPAEVYTAIWNQTLPAIGSLVGNNLFNIIAEDVTPSPYNQPPFEPAGDTDAAVCTVTASSP